MTRTEAKRLKLTRTLEEAHALADRALASVRSAARRKREKPPRAPGTSKVTRSDLRAADYTVAKAQAAARASEPSNEHLGPRCEYVVGSYRCDKPADDPDHVLGGAMKAQCERLGAEGLMWLCRGHHDLKTANAPTRAFWLDVQAAHALRHGYRRLLALIEKARAKYEAKRPARYYVTESGRSPQGGGTP